jgi:thiol-disulfide isomerase/thioredoxin
MLEKEIQIPRNSKRQEILRIKIQDLTRLSKDLSDLEGNIYKGIQVIYQQHYTRQLEYVNKNNSVISYYLLYEVLNRNKDKIDLNLVIKYYKKLSGKYPKHPYTELVGNLLESIKNIKIGGRYIDFSAPDINGKIIKTSDIINGKIALIDLWSTWCGPCILLSRSVVPVFEEYKDKGFTVLGVAANKNRNEIIKMMAKENHPWTTLIEVDNQNKIWEKYGISNWGGSTFLVGKDGKIISISPSPDEIRNILRATLK